MLGEFAGHVRTARRGVYPQNEDKGEEHHRLEGYASQTRHGGAVYLPVVRHVKEFLAERNEENLRYDDAGAEYA